MVVGVGWSPIADNEAAVEELRHLSGARILPLAPLSPEATAALVRSRYFPDAGDEACDAVHAATAGLPGLEVALLAALDTEGAAPTPQSVDDVIRDPPHGTARAIEGRLRRHSHLARRI